ncbi:MAG TPA: hypothetical protein VIV15_13665, partial [Anaerolineales bacterium]
CLRTCPYDNLAINLRPFSADLAHPSARMDEAFKAFVMLGSAMVYAAVLLGPWGALKDAAYLVGTPAWFVYALVFLAFIFILMPSLFAFIVSFSGKRDNLKKRFTTYSTALIPLGLMFWVAFSISFVLTNATYIVPPSPTRWASAGICSTPPISPGSPYSLRSLLPARRSRWWAAWSGPRAPRKERRVKRKHPLTRSFCLPLRQH